MLKRSQIMTFELETLNIFLKQQSSQKVLKAYVFTSVY